MSLDPSINSDVVAEATFSWLDRVTAGQWRDKLGTMPFKDILGNVETYIYDEGEYAGKADLL